MTIREVIRDEVATAPEIARLTERPVKWVQAAIRRLNIKAKYLVGERQFTAADVMRIVLLARLLQEFGETSGLPYAIVQGAAPAIESLYSHPDEGTVLSHQSSGPLRIVVSVPGLRELITGICPST